MIGSDQPEKDIVDQIKTVITRVFVSGVPAGVDPGDPYVIVYFGEPIHSVRDRHITTVRHDTMIGYFTVQVVSQSEDATTTVKNAIKDALVGFRPYGSGEVTPHGGVSRSRAPFETVPQMFYREMGFSYWTNFISE